MSRHYVAKFNRKVWKKATPYVAEPSRSEAVKSPASSRPS
jgi:hypothetical protein